jgi:hypothetical protein
LGARGRLIVDLTGFYDLCVHGRKRERGEGLGNFHLTSLQYIRIIKNQNQTV